MGPFSYFIWLLYAVLLTSCRQLLRFGGTVDPCVDECVCYDWETFNMAGDLERRFTVNCTGTKFGLFQGTNLPKNLPYQL